jgi:hypothetical protein
LNDWLAIRVSQP